MNSNKVSFFAFIFASYSSRTRNIFLLNVNQQFTILIFLPDSKVLLSYILLDISEDSFKTFQSPWILVLGVEPLTALTFRIRCPRLWLTANSNRIQSIYSTLKSLPKNKKGLFTKINVKTVAFTKRNKYPDSSETLSSIESITSHFMVIDDPLLLQD